MLVVIAMAGVILALLRKSSCPWDALPVALFCLSPVAIRMAAGFYAEPFAALMLLMGWNMAGSGRRLTGALVMGLAGMFRPEAGVVAAVFAAGACMIGSMHRERLSALAASVAPTFAWCAICRALGWETLPDWDVGTAPKFAQVVYAACSEAKSLELLVLPVAAVAFLVRPVCRMRLCTNAARAFAPMALLLLAIPAACGFYVSPHGEWMVDNTIPRLGWYVSAVPLSGLLASRS